MRATIAIIVLAAIASPAVTPSVMAQQAEQTYGHTTPEDATAAFNREQAQLARQQLEENTASQRAYEEALMARQALMRQQRNAWELEKTRLEREHEQAMERWRADVEACKKGHRDRCAKN